MTYRCMLDLEFLLFETCSLKIYRKLNRSIKNVRNDEKI